MYPKSKSPSETKYERLRGMCSGAWENVRYIPIDNGIQRSTAGMAVAENGRAWRYMVGVVCISVYGQHGGRGERYAVGAGQHGRKEGGILVYNIRTQYTPAIARASQRPGACIACACVRYIIILL